MPFKTLEELQALKVTPKQREERLRRLQKFIMKEPKRFNLKYWLVKITKNTTPLDMKYNEIGAFESIKAQRPPCNSVACLAGEVCLMAKLIPLKMKKSSKYLTIHAASNYAAAYLGLSENEASKLFFLRYWTDTPTIGWPTFFEIELSKYDPGTVEYAQVAVDRIEHFINAGE